MTHTRRPPADTIEPTVEGATLRFGDGLGVSFMRTLRIPDDGKRHPLPPGLGTFPLRRVDDYADRVPSAWAEHGGVFLPMYQREAMWLSFHGPHWKPRALKVGVGKVCAITGKRWSESLHRKPQDFVVAPLQPWLDGIATGRGTIRQFVAMPLGMGYTVEGQVTGEERFGGIQLKVFEPRDGIFPDGPPPERSAGVLEQHDMMCAPQAAPTLSAAAPRQRSGGAMGLGAGGRMKQKVYPDPHGIDTWDEHRTARLFVHIVNSELWREITGEAPPPTPVTAREYARHGLPWFDLYDEDAPALEAQPALGDIQSIKQMDQAKSTVPLQDDDPVGVGPVHKLWTTLATGLGVRDGEW